LTGKIEIYSPTEFHSSSPDNAKSRQATGAACESILLPTIRSLFLDDSGGWRGRPPGIIAPTGSLVAVSALRAFSAAFFDAVFDPSGLTTPTPIAPRQKRRSNG
jgi:hypothetical protein